MSNSNNNYDTANAVNWLFSYVDVKKFFYNPDNTRRCFCITVSDLLRRKLEILQNFALCFRLNGKRYPEYLSKLLRKFYDRPKANLAGRVNPCDWRDLHVGPKIHSLVLTSHVNIEVEKELRIIEALGSVSPEDFDKYCDYLHIKMDNEIVGNSDSCDLRNRYLKVLQFLQDHRKLLPFDYFTRSQVLSLPPLTSTKSRHKCSNLCKKCNKSKRNFGKPVAFRRKSRTVCYVHKEYHRGLLTAEKILFEDYSEESEHFGRIRSSTSFCRAPLMCEDIFDDCQMEDKILSDIKKRIDDEIQQNVSTAQFKKYSAEKNDAASDSVSFHEEPVTVEPSDPQREVESVFADVAPAEDASQSAPLLSAARSGAAIDDIDQVIEKIIDNLVICEAKVRARARERGLVLDELSSPREWSQEQLTNLLKSVSSDEDEILPTDVSCASSVDSSANSSTSLKSCQRLK